MDWEQNLRGAAKSSYVIGGIITFLTMLALGLAGVMELGLGLVSFVQGLLGHPSGGTHTVVSTLEGLELLLLSPLAFVTVVSIGRYLGTLLPRSGDADLAEHQLHRVKALIISLIISVVATDLVKRFLGRSDIDLAALVYGGVVMVLLMIYLIILYRVRPS